jgi:hypothetical protein
LDCLSLCETFSEGLEQRQWPFDANPSQDDLLDHRGFLVKHAQPGLCIGMDTNARYPRMSHFNPDRFVLDDDRCFGLLTAAEREMIGRVQPFGLVPLESNRSPGDKVVPAGRNLALLL